MSKVDIDFNRYPRFQELETIWKTLADEYPGLVKLYSIGKSFHGKELWALELTNRETGAPDAKPGYYIDGVTHPEEVSGAMVATYTAWYLLSEYGSNDMVTRLLDSQTVYIIPVVNPDGYEVCMDGLYYEWHGNVRYLPGMEQEGTGLHYQDLNGDCFITRMRVMDPKGEWKVSEKDSRLMLPREPYEYGGEYYRVLPEGVIQDFDGVEFDIPRPIDGNTNRNYPSSWAPEAVQYGAGAYPMSEPEIKAVVKFILTHPNIAGSINFHTNAGVILPPFQGTENPMSYSDFQLFIKLGRVGAEETGYRMLMSEEEFSGKMHNPRRGTSTGFLYNQQGILAFVVELWDVYNETGIGPNPSSRPRELSEEDGLKLLKWNDELLGGESFLEWTPFEHPQLGKVEIGGWQTLFMFRNPPPSKLKEMCHKNMGFTLKHALSAPIIKITKTKVTHIDGNIYKIEATVENHGFLNTNVTEQAIVMKTVEPVTITIKCGDGAKLVSPKPTLELGQLSGWSERKREYNRFSNWGPPARKAEWIVKKTDEETEITLTASSTKAGKETMKLIL
jgi:murein tripeptide amidase MpaA